MGYTEEEFRAALAAETAPLLTRLAELEAVQQTTEVAGLIAAAVTDAAGQVEELRTQLDVVVLEKQAAVDALAAVETKAAELVAAAEAEKQLGARRDERLKRVTEVANFPQDHLDGNADRWAAMDEDDFSKLLHEYASLTGAPRKDVIPKGTAQMALHAGRETASAGDSDGVTLYKNVVGAGVIDSRMDPRTLHLLGGSN